MHRLAHLSSRLVVLGAAAALVVGIGACGDQKV